MADHPTLQSLRLALQILIGAGVVFRLGLLAQEAMFDPDVRKRNLQRGARVLTFGVVAEAITVLVPLLMTYFNGGTPSAPVGLGGFYGA